MADNILSYDADVYANALAMQVNVPADYTRAMQVTPGIGWQSNVVTGRSGSRIDDGQKVYVYEPTVGEVDDIAKQAGVTPEDVCAEMWEMIAEKMFGPHAEPGLQAALVLRLAPRALEVAEKKREAKAHQDKMDRMMREMEQQHNAMIQKQLMERRDEMLRMPMSNTIDPTPVWRSINPAEQQRLADAMRAAKPSLLGRLFNFKGCV